MQWIDHKSTPKSIRKLLRKLVEAKIDYSAMIRLRIADRKGNLKHPNYTFGEIRKMLEKVENEVFRKDTPTLSLAINGHDVMNTLGIPPGKEVGQILKKLEEIVIESPDLNKREVLLHFLEEGRYDF